jgi:hypothetical protein
MYNVRFAFLAKRLGSSEVEKNESFPSSLGIGHAYPGKPEVRVWEGPSPGHVSEDSPGANRTSGLGLISRD